MNEDRRGRRPGSELRPSTWVGAACVLIGIAIGSVGTYVWLSSRERPAPSGLERQAAVHRHGHAVMPFALDRTTHVFEMTTTGGIQDVVVKSPADSAQIPLIRRHLSREAERFRAGDFSDPRSLHGEAMPGLRELSAAGERLEVEYRDLPAGGRIVYTSSDPDLITAIHRWFGAQLSDHGADATYR
jgi:hypothetical protein